MTQFSKGQFYRVKTYNIEDEDEKETTTKIDYCKCQRISTGNYQKHCKNGPVSSHQNGDVKKERKRRDITSDVNIDASYLSYVFDFNTYEPVLFYKIQFYKLLFYN